MRTAFRFAVYLAAAAIVFAACAKQGGQGGGLFGNNVANSSFPVYSPSSVEASTKYDDSAEITALGNNMFGEGADSYKPYIGVQELIKTSATDAQLQAWLKSTIDSPPADLVPTENTKAREAEGTYNAQVGVIPSPGASGAESSSTPGATETAAPAAGGTPNPESTGMEDPFVASFRMFGIVPAGFYTKDRGRAVLIMIVDPKAVADHLGPAMDMFDQYEKTPAILRGAIDEVSKKNLGFSVSDLMNTNTPMGMIVYATRQWKGQDTRAIVLVDAERQPNPLPTPHATGT